MAADIDRDALAKRTGFPRFLNLKEAAVLSRAPIKTLRFWIASGRLKSFRPGRLVLVRVDDLEAFMSGKPQPSQEAEKAA